LAEEVTLLYLFGTAELEHLRREIWRKAGRLGAAIRLRRPPEVIARLRAELDEVRERYYTLKRRMELEELRLIEVTPKAYDSRELEEKPTPRFWEIRLDSYIDLRCVYDTAKKLPTPPELRWVRGGLRWHYTAARVKVPPIIIARDGFYVTSDVLEEFDLMQCEQQAALIGWIIIAPAGEALKREARACAKGRRVYV